VSSVLVDVEGSNGGVGDGTKAESIRKVVVAGVVVLDVECFSGIEAIGLGDGELTRRCRWIACCVGGEDSWGAASGWRRKEVGTNVQQMDLVEFGVVDDGGASIDGSGDDAVGSGTTRVVVDAEAFGLHPALCEEGVFESWPPEGHVHVGW
jgi:hypothetical protein